MHIHILGIGGTFMAGLAQLARAAGHHVTGCDSGVYPPMSTQLEAAEIEVIEGYDSAQTAFEPDCYVVGNAITRGNALLEEILDRGLPYLSGPQWLAENILKEHWVMAVAGTHGKTTASAMLAWILEDAGLSPGFLVGGVPVNFGVSARLSGSNTDTPFFVIEADEYDTAFCDKRSKFIHYRPRTLVLNNLEFDHADIFSDLAAIETQFHHFVRTLPRHGLIVSNAADGNLERVLARGCWTPVKRFNDTAGWRAEGNDVDGSLQLLHGDELLGSKLVHGDFGANNMLVENGQIKSVIDWENSLYGDPLYDISIAYFWSSWLICMEMSAKYWEDLLSKTEDYHRRIKCYQLRIALHEIYDNATDNDSEMVSWLQKRTKEILD
jgi:UDP-N-acetylmuramate: L-alanyl-gamma-D-glutamyl-meso-diaminopimelate ligase